MEFIRVTLYESLVKAGKMSNRKQLQGYLLPVHGIKSLALKITSQTGSTYYVSIAKGFEPEDIGFEVGSIEAELPKSLVRVLN